MEADNLFTGIVAEVNKFIGEFHGEMPKVIGKDKFMEQPQTDYAKRKEFDILGQTGVINQLASGRDPEEMVKYGLRHLRGRK